MTVYQTALLQAATTALQRHLSSTPYQTTATLQHPETWTWTVEGTPTEWSELPTHVQTAALQIHQGAEGPSLVLQALGLSLREEETMLAGYPIPEGAETGTWWYCYPLQRCCTVDDLGTMSEGWLTQLVTDLQTLRGGVCLRCYLVPVTPLDYSTPEEPTEPEES